MSLIKLETFINAPVQRCFDLSRSIDLHKASTKQTNEEAVDGVTKGLIGDGETVTWRAKHFGIVQYMTTTIDTFQPPVFFISRMVKGLFKKIEHKHYFSERGNGTLMKDEFYFEAPFGIFGRLFCALVLTTYMRRFLVERNELIKQVAESNKWKNYLNS